MRSKLTLLTLTSNSGKSYHVLKKTIPAETSCESCWTWPRMSKNYVWMYNTLWWVLWGKKLAPGPFSFGVDSDHLSAGEQSKVMSSAVVTQGQSTFWSPRSDTKQCAVCDESSSWICSLSIWTVKVAPFWGNSTQNLLCSITHLSPDGGGTYV
jgi:hypothetical protein